MLDRIRGGLIVSVQAEAESLLNTPETIALLARVAERNGGAAVRIEGAARIDAVCRAVRVPVIGLVKRAYPGFAPYITPTAREIDEVLDAGAAAVAFDATLRPRPGGVLHAGIIARISARGRLAMADCAEAADARHAAAAGAHIVASTLCGYTEETRGMPLPALELVRAMRGLAFNVCEGGVGSAAAVAAAFAAGADAVVVGTAITNVDVLVRNFVAATPAGAKAT
ncbi:MAG: putative N-acetylmannosamine-6-phosphate 2-epimerase [Candidatus Velthaea sp.]